ncbi:MAG: hypothetical protein KAU60_11885 [Desulfobacterales bacterium]|jgi:hypothetical protein|nr:hypothetical protein [Desulfobacterales bacterium]
MSDDKFKLPLSSYDELVKFIKAYSHVTKPTELGEISKLTGVAAPNISRNVGFFVATGILEGGKKKMPTPVGQQLGHALEHEMPDEIRKSWRHIVEEDEFLTKLLTAVRIRNGMDSQTLEAHIAYSAGQPKKHQFMTGARTVIDILKAAELIVEVDGKYLLKDPSEVPEAHADSPAQNESLREPQIIPTHPPRTPIAFPVEAYQGVQINIQININCTPDDVPGLGTQVKAMIQEIADSEASDVDGDE